MVLAVETAITVNILLSVVKYKKELFAILKSINVNIVTRDGCNYDTAADQNFEVSKTGMQINNLNYNKSILSYLFIGNLQGRYAVHNPHF